MSKRSFATPLLVAVSLVTLTATTVKAAQKPAQTYKITNHSQTFTHPKRYHVKKSTAKVYQALLKNDGESIVYKPKATLTQGQSYHALRKTHVKDRQGHSQLFYYIVEKHGWVKQQILAKD
ncbi:hypothetical protein ACFQ22_11775 [Lentilactobacillus raoultii]|uniref:Surface layer protein A domain-containing protein n=1 Tax=Lentilactobacillus raoultii TaxID=1987503 RepID=A0ABW3PVP5_9LACO|nr:hypothetical protein [Lentilactobacillus raoultii]